MGGRSLLRKSFRKNFEFQDATLRRATRVSDVLRCCGIILQNSEGSASTYGLSGAVDRIDGFISHNWVTGRFIKFVTLAMHYNLVLAAVATLGALAMLCTVLISLECLPVDNYAYGTISLVCTPFGTPLFFCFLFFIRDLGPYIGVAGPKVFLDKVCIHQEDPDLKRQGLKSLGAFLYEAKILVIVYTDVYLQRLWTVFELACFLTLRSSKDIVVLRTMEPQIATASALIWYASVVAYTLYSVWVSELFGLNADHVMFVLSVPLLVALIGIAVGLRRLARDKANSLCQACNFHASQASCAYEEDRTLVNGMIVLLMKDLGWAEADSSYADTLNAFDDVVHASVPASLSCSFGTTGLPYSHILVVVQATFWLQCDRLLGFWHEGESLQYIVAHLIMATTLYFAVLPSLIVLIFYISTRRLHDDGWMQAVVLIAAPICCTPLWAMADVVLSFLRDEAKNSIVALTAFGGLEALCFVFIYAIFRTRENKVWPALPSSRPWTPDLPESPDKEHSSSIDDYESMTCVVPSARTRRASGSSYGSKSSANTDDMHNTTNTSTASQAANGRPPLARYGDHSEASSFSSRSLVEPPEISEVDLYPSGSPLTIPSPTMPSPEPEDVTIE